LESARAKKTVIHAHRWALSFLALSADAPDQAFGFVLDDDALGRRLDDLTIALRQLREGLELLAQFGASPALFFMEVQHIAADR